MSTGYRDSSPRDLTRPPKRPEARPAGSFEVDKFHVTIDVTGEQGLVRVSGEIDAATADTLDEALDRLVRHGIRRFVLDFTDVTFMDSTGLRSIVCLVANPYSTVTIAHAPPMVQKLLRITRIDDHVTLI